MLFSGRGGYHTGKKKNSKTQNENGEVIAQKEILKKSIE